MTTRIRLHTDTDPTGRIYVDIEDDELAQRTVLRLLTESSVTVVTIEKDVAVDRPLASYRWLPCNCGRGDCTLGVLEDSRGRAVEYGNTLQNSISTVTMPGRQVCSAGVR